LKKNARSSSRLGGDPSFLLCRLLKQASLPSNSKPRKVEEGRTGGHTKWQTNFRRRGVKSPFVLGVGEERG